MREELGGQWIEIINGQKHKVYSMIYQRKDKEICMVVNFEVGKTYVYNGKIGDPSPFVAIDIEEQDALFIVSGEPLVCTYVENHSCPFIKFEGMSSARGWILNVCDHLFDEVKEKTSGMAGQLM